MATDEDILDFLRTNQGTRFTLGQIARHFNVFPVALLPTIKVLTSKNRIEVMMEGVTKKYFVLSQLEEQFKVKQEFATAFKPLSAEYMKMIRWAMTKRAN